MVERFLDVVAACPTVALSSLSHEVPLEARNGCTYDRGSNREVEVVQAVH
jgi:hypothetical protein